MLKYSCVVTSEGLRVTFAREASWVSPIATAILLIALRSFGINISQIDDAKGFLFGIFHFAKGEIAFLFVLAAIFALGQDLRRYRYIFSQTGITRIATYFGVTVKTQFFAPSEIHKFGCGTSPHAGNRNVLRFFASGQRYVLAHDVSEHEADEFLDFLASHQIAYSGLDEPLERRSAANTLLGPY